MADIDPLLLSAELGISNLLALQVVLAVVAVVVGIAGRRRWSRIVLPVALILAAAACGGTLYRCAESRESVRGRLEGRVTGPHLPTDRAENHLAWLAGRERLSIGITAATGLVGGLLYFSTRRARPAQPKAAPDPAA
ncbi:MAG TPA: hypothetical protein VKD90_15740 [Gemmataceae bacterium]|nr:hypothetical protein [Gemmataceae bacterium]